MLDAAAEQGEVLRRALPQVKEVLEAASQAELFLGWDGDGAEETVDVDSTTMQVCVTR